MIKKIYSSLIKKIRSVKWSHETFYIKNKVKKINSIVPLRHSNVALILAPHSDDEWIGCSQVFLKKYYKTIVVCNMNMSGGDNEIMHKRRIDEMKKNCDENNLIFEDILEKKKENLVKIIKKIKPDAIFSPFFIDWHKEHLKSIDLLYNSLKESKYNGLIYSYQVSLPLLVKKANCYIPMSKTEFNKKWNDFKRIYNSQIKIPYRRFMFNEIINGKYTGSYACELFFMLNTTKWINMYESINKKNISYNKLYDDINSIRKTRNNLEKIYNELF